MIRTRTTIKTIQAKDGRVIAPATRLDVMPWPDARSGDGWRIAFVAGDRNGIVQVSQSDLQARTAPDF